MIDRNWPAMFRDPFSPLSMGAFAQGAYGAGYAEGMAAGMQAAQLAAGGCYGPQGQMPFGPEAALDLALQRFFAQAAGVDPTAGFAPQPGLAYAMQAQMQQMNQMGALGASQGVGADMSGQMAQDFQLLVCLVAFAMIMGSRQAGGVNGGGGAWGGGRVFGNGFPNGGWGQQQKVPGGWDGRPGWGQNIPDWNPGNFGGSGLGSSLAACAENVAGRRGTVGWCFAGAKESIARATGVHLEGGSAYMAANQLAQSGRFREVNVSPDQLRHLPAGAVVVWGQTNVSPHGHISVALGDGREASDHVQRQMTSLRGHTNYRVFMPA